MKTVLDRTETALPKTAPLDPRAIWRNCTEDLIFAAAYYDDPRSRAVGWLRVLAKRCLVVNEQDEDRKCREVCLAINALSPHLGTQLERAHAANEHLSFRLQHLRCWPREDALVLARSSGRRYAPPAESPSEAAERRAAFNRIMVRGLN